MFSIVCISIGLYYFSELVSEHLSSNESLKGFIDRDPGSIREVSKKGYEGDSDDESSDSSPIVEKTKQE